MRVERIVASQWLERAKGLALDHWREVGQELGLPEPTIDPHHVAILEQAGALFAIGAIDGDTLVGYSLNVVGPTLNFSAMRVCQNEGLFVDKAHRGTAAMRLIRETEAEAARLSCRQIIWHTYRRTRAEALFERRAYTDHGSLWSKEITPCPPVYP